VPLELIAAYKRCPFCNQRAETIIANCAHPDYRGLLRDYIRIGGSGSSHSPQTLAAAFGMHGEFSRSGDMRSTSWDSFRK
jgi:acyl-CoA hydrolase